MVIFHRFLVCLPEGNNLAMVRHLTLDTDILQTWGFRQTWRYWVKHCDILRFGSPLMDSPDSPIKNGDSTITGWGPRSLSCLFLWLISWCAYEKWVIIIATKWFIKPMESPTRGFISLIHLLKWWFWWLVGSWTTPLTNLKVSWDDEIPIFGRIKTVPNHQPVIILVMNTNGITSEEHSNHT